MVVCVAMVVMVVVWVGQLQGQFSNSAAGNDFTDLLTANGACDSVTLRLSRHSSRNIITK